MKLFTHAEVIQKLKDRIENSQLELAEEIGISPVFLCAVMNGRKAPSPKILKFLGLEKAVSYRKIGSRS